MSRFITPAVVIGVAVAAAVAAPGADNGTVSGTVAAKGLPNAANIVISLEAPGLAARPPAAPLEVDQKNQVFIPHVLPVVRGATVRFLNSDPFAHNVFSPEGRYDLGSWPQGQAREHTFTKAGVYTQLCRVHPEMEAFIVVLDTPYFATTRPDGAFQIANVPAGRYTLVAWSDKLKTTRQAVTVEPGKNTSVQVTLGR
jgi:plastocyanin